MEFLYDFLIEDAWIVVAALWVIGKMLKDSPITRNWIIPFILLPLGILATVFLLGFNAESVMQGVIATGLSVFGYELVKNIKERK